MWTEASTGARATVTTPVTRAASPATCSAIIPGEAGQPARLAQQIGHQPRAQEIAGGDPLRGALLQHEARSEQRGRDHAKHVFHAAAISSHRLDHYMKKAARCGPVSRLPQAARRLPGSSFFAASSTARTDALAVATSRG